MSKTTLFRILTGAFGGVAALFLTLSAAQAMGAESLDEILAKHVEALGGEAAIRKVASLERSGSITVETDFAGTQRGQFELAVIPREKIYQSSDLGPFSTASGWNGEAAWERSARGLRFLGGVEAQRLAAQSDIFFTTGLWRDEASRIERLPDEDIDGTAHYVLKFQSGEMGDLTAYFNKETYLLTQVTMPIDIEGVGEVLSITGYWDYAEFGGVKFPTTVSISVVGIFTTETVFEKTTVNGSVDDSRFLAPAEE